MATIKGLDEYYKKINDIAKKAFEKVCKNYKNKLREYINKEWYQEHKESNYYDRTKDFLNCFDLEYDFTQDGEFKCFLYANPEKLQIHIAKHGKLNAHADIHGKDVRERIPYFIDMGNGDSPIKSYEGIKWVENFQKVANEEFQKDFDKEFEKLLKKNWII